MIYDGIPQKKVKYMKYTKENKDIVEKMAQEYLNSKKVKRNYIKKGMIIPVEVVKYIMMDNSIKCYYKTFRNDIEFPAAPVMVEPYEYGKRHKEGSVLRTLKINTKSVREKLLSGIIDANYVEGNIIRICDDEFRNDVIFIARTLGYDIVDIGDNKISIIGDMSRLRISSKMEHKNNSRTYDFVVENKGVGDYYGFSVDCNERYVLADCIVTYNSNGKSVITSLVKRLFGEYYSAMDHTVITGKRGNSSAPSPELADKQGKRLVIMQEPEETDTIKSSLMKQLTGETDEICARALYKSGFTYTPQFKLIMICNNMPKLASSDEGTKRRILVVLYDSWFVDSNMLKQIKENDGKIFKKDFSIGEKIKSGAWVAPLMWLLLKKYYPMYEEMGLTPPDEVRKATEKYKESSDHYREYINKIYIVTKKPTDVIPTDEFVHGFQAWFKSTMVGDRLPTRNLILSYIDSSELKREEDKIIGIKLKVIEDELVNDDK